MDTRIPVYMISFNPLVATSAWMRNTCGLLDTGHRDLLGMGDGLSCTVTECDS